MPRTMSTSTGRPALRTGLRTSTSASSRSGPPRRCESSMSDRVRGGGSSCTPARPMACSSVPTATRVLSTALDGRRSSFQGAEIESSAPLRVRSSRLLPSRAATRVRFARETGAMAVFDRHEDWPGHLEGLKDAFPPGAKREIFWMTVNSPRIWRAWDALAITSADLVITVSRKAAETPPARPKGPCRRFQLHGPGRSSHAALLTVPRTPAPHLLYWDDQPEVRPRRDGRGYCAAALGIRAGLVCRGRGRAQRPRDASSRSGGGRSRRFCGWRSRDEALSRVSDSHACVPSLRDNGLTRTTVGNKLFEYMALARAVLCSGVGVMSRLVRDTGAGVVVIHGRRRVLSRSLLAEPEWTAAMGSRGREAVRATYNWARESQGFVAAYAGLGARAEGEVGA